MGDSVVFTNDYIDGLLSPISEDEPAGINVEYDPDFMALQAMLPDTADSAIEGEEADAAKTDWRGARTLAESIFTKSFHLPTAVILTAALIEIRSLEGLRDGLGLIANMMTNHWDGFWPRIDPDDEDILERENALTSLSPPVGAYGDALDMANRVRDAVIVSGPRAGSLTLRCIDGEPDPSKNQGDASIVLPDAAPEEVEQACETAEQCLEAINAIHDALAEHASMVTLDLSMLKGQLEEIQQTLAAFVGRQEVGESSGDAADGEGEGESVGGVLPARPAGAIESRSDVVEMLDKINEWYSNNEPGSPIPMLVEQIRGMVHMKFPELMETIYPDAVNNSRLMVKPPDEY